MRPLHVLRAVTALGAVSIAACSSGNVTGGTGAPAPSPTTHFPAFTPAVPQLERGSLHVMVAPVLIPIYIGEDPLRMPLDRALADWTGHGSTNAIAALAEYGVASVGLGASIDVPLQLASTVTRDGVQTWLTSMLDGTHPAFGRVDGMTLASEIFVGF